MKFYWGDRINGWRIWGVRFGSHRYVTVAVSINEWEAVEARAVGRTARQET